MAPVASAETTSANSCAIVSLQSTERRIWMLETALGARGREEGCGCYNQPTRWWRLKSIGWWRRDSYLLHSPIYSITLILQILSNISYKDINSVVPYEVQPQTFRGHLLVLQKSVGPHKWFVSLSQVMLAWVHNMYIRKQPMKVQPPTFLTRYSPTHI